jgi:hypothetical protein
MMDSAGEFGKRKCEGCRWYVVYPNRMSPLNSRYASGELAMASAIDPAQSQSKVEFLSHLIEYAAAK